jgi:hypothetical protein
MCHGAKIAVLGIQSKHAAIDWDLVVFNGLTIKTEKSSSVGVIDEVVGGQ